MKKERTLNGHLEDAWKHLEALEQQLDELSPQRRALAAEALVQLSIALEELGLAEEELHQQNAELAATREALEAERQRYQELFEFAPDGYLVTDHEGIIVEANQAASKLLRVPQDSLVGKPLIAFVAEEDHKTFSTGLAQLPSEGVDKVLGWELRIKPRKGPSFWATATVAAIRDSQGKVVGLHWLIHDITRRKRAQETLRESEERFRNLFATMSEGVVLISPDGQIIQANPAAERILGLQRAEIEERRYDAPEWEMLRPDGTPMPAEDWPSFRAMTEKRPIQNQVAGIKRPDGAISWMNINASPLVSEASRFEGAVVTFVDITERKQVQEALRESEERFRRAFEYAAIGMALVGTDGRFLQVNESACQMFGYSAGELVRKTFQKITYPDDLEVGLNVFQDLVAGKRDYGWLEKRYVHRDGHVIWALLSTAVVRNPQGAPLYLVSQIQDITERKRADDALRESEMAYRTLAENLPGIVYRIFVQENNRMQFFNRVAQEVTGYTDEELTPGQVCSIDPLIVPEDRTGVITEVQRAVAENRPFVVEYRLKHRDGNIRYMLEQGMPIHGPDGKPLYIDGVIFDITERRQVEEKLWQTNELLEKIFSSLHSMIAYMDADFNFIRVNRAYAEADERPPEFFVGKSHFDLYPNEENETIFRKVVETGEPYFVYEKPFVYAEHPERGVTYWDWRLLPVKEADGKVGGVILSLLNVTQRKRAEEAVRLQAQIIDQVHDSVVSTDLDGFVTSWNKGAERIFEYSADEALGQHISFVYDESQHEFLENEIIAPLKAKGSHEVEVSMRKRSGEEFHAHLSLSLLRDSAGAVTGMIGYSMDITGRMRADKELRIRARQQAVVAQLEQRALAGIDIATLMDEAVAQVAQALEVEYCKVLELLPGEDALLLRAGVGWKEGRVGYTRVEAETGSQAGYTLLSGEPVIVEDLRTERRFSNPPLLTEHGVISGISVVIPGQEQPFGILGAHTIRRRTFTQDDIYFLQAVAGAIATAIERKQAEEALRASEERSRMQYMGIPVPTYTWQRLGEDFVLVDYNEAAVASTGGRIREFLGTKLSQMYANSPDILEDFARCFQERTMIRREMAYQSSLTDTRGYFVVSYIPISPDLILVHAEDITERKEAEEALRQQAERLAVLHEIDEAILAAQSLEEIAQAALRYVRQLVPCLGADVIIFDLDTDKGTVLSTHLNDSARLHPETRVPLEVFGNIEEFRQGKAHVVEDIQTVSLPQQTLQTLRAHGVRSYINLPLVAQGELVGSLNLGSDRPGAFATEHLAIAREVADSLAIAIQQTRLFEQLSSTHEQLRALSRRLLDAEENERRRIARELHDEIGQALTVVKINLQALQRLKETTEPAPRLAESIGVVERALQQVRNLSLDLRPSLLDDLGLVATLRWYVDRQAQWGGFAAQFTADPLEMAFSPEVETTCFRVVQEALTNVMRHAQARQVRVELRQHDAELELIICDDGRGFDVKAALTRAASGASLGLLGMQERVRLVEGQFDIKSAPGCGTEIRVRFPMGKM
jgi:PAS domain S-box-containing protein